MRCVLFWRSAVRLTITCSIFLFALVSTARADPVSQVDPHIIYATGGDATPITTDGISIDLSAGGGGIFVFQNDTGADLSMLDVKVQFPFPVFAIGFTVADTIFVGTPAQQASFSDSLFNNVTCADLGGFSSTTSCLAMQFGLNPGPLAGKGQNFVLNFDFPLTSVDLLVEKGQYTGGTDTSEARVGDWPSDAPAGVTPVTVAPEPGTFGLLVIGGFGLAIGRRQKLVR
jgi:hypothetical protein